MLVDADGRRYTVEANRDAFLERPLRLGESDQRIARRFRLRYHDTASHCSASYYHNANRRQEAFCRHIAAGETQAGAYAKAGYKTHSINVTRVNACRLLTKANVQLRVRELQREAAAQSVMTVNRSLKSLTRCTLLPKKTTSRPRVSQPLA